jgi:hypothetical protein
VKLDVSGGECRSIPIRVAAVSNGVDLHDVRAGIDPVQDAVRPPSDRVQSFVRLAKRLADPVGIVGQRSGDQLVCRRSDLLRQIFG